MSKKLLTVSLLVSGREETTKKCLDSLAGLLQELDSELILVDTGCGEELRRELSGYTDQIISFAWCDDFAKARNAGLERASGEWFLFLDDDEWFEDVGPIIAFFKTGEYKDYHQAVYRVRNYSNAEGTRYTDEWVSRMIRMEADTRFEGRVHESLVPAVGKCKKIDAFAHHYGYVFADEEAREKHFERNVEILLRLIDEEPDNLRWRLQILQEYYSSGKGKQLCQAGQSALELISDLDRPFVNECRGAFQSAVLFGHELQKEYGELELACQAFLGDTRNTSQGICSLCAAGAAGANMRKDKESIMQYGKRYFQALEEHQSDIRDEQAQIIAESIVFVKDAVTEEKQEEMRCLWAWACAGLGRAEDFPADQREKLIASVQKLIDGNGEFLFLPDGFWETAAGGVLPLEELLLGLPLSQWMAVVMVLNAKNKPSEWRKVRERLNVIRTRDDIRYDFIDMHDSNMIVSADLTNQDYDNMCRILERFAESNLRYARRVYTEQAFAGGMEMLSESCRAAVWINRMFACGEQDWNQRLKYLKKSALEWRALGENIKYFAKLIGEEQEKAAEQAKEANNELYAMAKQVKMQVRTLMDAGMDEEALSIVQQLQAMLSDDSETAGLEKELRRRKENSEKKSGGACSV